MLVCHCEGFIPAAIPLGVVLRRGSFGAKPTQDDDNEDLIFEI